MYASISKLIAAKHGRNQQVALWREWKPEVFRQHAGNRVRFAIDARGFADNRGVAPESALPKPVGDQYHAAVAGLLGIGFEIAPQLWLYAQSFQKSRRYLGAWDALGLRAASGKVELA